MPDRIESPPAADVAYLVAQAGGLRQVFGLVQETTRIGRSYANDVCLPLTTVSKTHASILRTPMGFKIADAGSRNGLGVNGARVMEHFLQEGDRVQIGEVSLQFTRRNPGKDSDTRDMPAMSGPSAPTRRVAAVAAPRSAAPWASAAAIVLAAAVGAGVVALVSRPAAAPKPVDLDALRAEVAKTVGREWAEQHKQQGWRIEAFVTAQRDELAKLRADGERLASDLARRDNESARLSEELNDLADRLDEVLLRLEALSKRPEPAPSPAPAPPSDRMPEDLPEPPPFELPPIPIPIPPDELEPAPPPPPPPQAPR